MTNLLNNAKVLCNLSNRSFKGHTTMEDAKTILHPFMVVTKISNCKTKAKSIEQALAKNIVSVIYQLPKALTITIQQIVIL